MPPDERVRFKSLAVDITAQGWSARIIAVAVAVILLAFAWQIIRP
jgi:hypothetical protein